MKADKKMAAAVAAVDRYLEIEASESGRCDNRFAGAAFAGNPWGFSGRMDHMQMRTLMQLRISCKRIGSK